MPGSGRAIASDLPGGLVLKGRSATFTPGNLPPRLREAHVTKPATWGLLHVLAGSIEFCLASPFFGRKVVAAGETVVIEPEVPHQVAFIEPGRFYIAFYREKSAD